MKLSKALTIAALMIGGFQAAAATGVPNANCEAAKKGSVHSSDQATMKKVDLVWGSSKRQQAPKAPKQSGSTDATT